MSNTLVFRGKNQALVDVAVTKLREERPMTLRQLYYRLISAGALKNDQKEYKRLGNIMTRLRESGQVPRTWIVDHVRDTLKPSSWTGLADFGDTVREAYRKDFWASLPHHVEIFVEKDAIAGTIQPITRKYDVALHVCRGYSSVSFAGEIADVWQDVRKPIFAFYLGDFDPSGFDLERDLRGKLERYSGRLCRDLGAVVSLENLSVHLLAYDEWLRDDEVYWFRLAVREEDFQEHNLIPLPVKMTDCRAKRFMETYGTDQACAEVDALSPNELRSRVETAILAHIDPERWERLQEVERMEQESLAQFMNGWKRES